MSQKKMRASRGAGPARRCFFTPLLAERLEPRNLLSLSPQLVTDLNTTAAGIEVVGSMAEVGNVAYFMGRDLVHGFELWKSTGAAGGASLVKDIEPGPNGSYPADLVNVNGTLYFSAGHGAGDFELWKSDGTAAGTVRVRDLQPGEASSDPRGLTNVNGTLFFTASDGVSGKELWKSDGTAAGTVLVKDVNPGPAGSEARELVNRNGQLLFVANDGVNGDELWRSDGTATGTALVKDIRTGPASGMPSTLSLLSGAAIFMAFDDTIGFGLWRSDGTTAGTTLLKDLHPGTLVNPEFRQPTNVSGTLFFATNDGVNGFELWKTDGTPAGTALVKDIAAGGDSSYPDSLANVSGVLFLRATTGSGSELWKSNGTAAGTVLVKDIRPGPDSSYPLVLTNRNGTLFFAANDGVSGYELWRSDGSGAGTVLVKDARLGLRSSYPDALLNLNGTLLFSADRGSDGAELWISDGTTAGTMLSPQGGGTASSAPRQLVNVNGTVFFTAASVGGDEELWKTDPATGVVALVKDIRPGGVGSQPGELTVVGNTLFFVADDGATGLELWKSDGTAAGTTLIREIQPGAGASSAVHALTNVNGVLFFIANDGINGAGLWKSNGTAAGTVLVKDIVPGADEYLPSGLTNISGTLFFSAFTAATGYELWRSDGTAAGTVLVKDIAAGAYSSGPQYLTNVNGMLFFRAAEASTGLELWRSDGTSAGTVLVGDINPGAASSGPRYLTNVGGLLYFSAEHPLTGAELWRSNGLAVGTALVKDILPGAESSYLGDLIDVNGALFFTAHDGARGDELWTSDGSTDGTVLVKNIAPGADASSAPRYLTNIGGVVFFAATDASGGREIWKSDGTVAGTSQFVDIAPGATPAFPGELLAVSGRLFFAAGDGVRGHELWSVLLYDRGDAAASFGTTPPETGPHHLAVGPQLGLIRDEELNAAPTAQATGDDLAGADDEDGLLAASIIRGALSSVTLRVQAAGGGAKLDAWIDFNHDGVFAAAEKVFDSLTLATGDSQLFFITPTSALVGPAVVRFRLSTAGNLGPNGPAADGEVEDHLLTVLQDLTVPLPTGNGTDRIKIQRNGNLIEVYDAPSNVILALSPLEFTNRLVVAGSATENDEITIDYASGGFFALTGGIELDGGVGGNDTLTVLGSASATSAKYLSRGLSLGNARLEIRSGAARNELAFVNFEPLTVSGMTTFEVEGVLDVGGQTLAVTANTFVKLGTLTTLAGGTFIAPGGVALAAGQVIQGAGTISGRIAAEAGSTIEAAGDLTLGDLASPAGFFSRGELRVRAHTVLLLDANQAVLGSLTTLGQAGLPGTLIAPSGAVVDFGSNVFGFGTLDTPNEALQPLMNNGVIQGNSAGEKVTLVGYVRGVGTLNQVTIAGTSSPGFSPAAVQFGSANFAPGGKLIVELAGETPGSGYDQVNFSGPATLGGTLKVELLGGFVPRVGSSFTVVTASSLSGNFAATVLPALPADRKWAVSSTATEVRLGVVPADTENPWHNLANALDVDGDGFVSPIDAVLIINYLNSAREKSVPNDADGGPPFLDVTGDYFIAPDDAVVVINHLNARRANAPTTEGEGEKSLSTVSPALLPDEVIALLAFDLLSTESGRRRR